MQYNRRLSDKILSAHAQACDEGRLDVAAALLRALEIEQTAIGGYMNTDKRKSAALLDEAYQRQEQAQEQGKATGKH